MKILYVSQYFPPEMGAPAACRWERYARSRINRTRALCYKSAFKLCYY